jgi:hypothetical protein
VKRVRYAVTISGWTVDSGDDPRTELVALETSTAMDSAGDLCHVRLYAPPAQRGGLLEQAAGAALGAVGAGGLGAVLGLAGEAGGPQLTVRGQNIAPGDAMTVELKVGDRSATVMTAQVQAMESGLEQVRVTGATATQQLAGTRVNQVYENQTVAQIAGDLAGQAGVQAGDIDQGSRISYFVAHESKSVLRCLRELARREGLDLYCDAQNRLTMKTFAKTGPDHIFRYGAELLALELTSHQASAERVRVVGESVASNKGADTWHWLARDSPPVSGQSSRGARMLAVSDGVVRTKAAADAYAAAWLGALKDQATSGRLKLLGNPEIVLGDAFEISDAPRPELNGLFKVVGVRHVLNKRDGFVTWVAFTGQGGASAAGDLLGGAVGAIGGALGL